MLATKLDITNMADFPAILGASAFQAANNGVKTDYIATLSGSTRGAGNAVVVPVQSKIQSFSELKGKRISVPFGSTAHAMLLRAIQEQGWDPDTDVNIITQAPEVAGSALKANQIDAHADFVPFGELFPFRGIARKIYDGSFTGLPTTHGVQVRSDFAEKYPELVVAYLKATIEASRLIREHPEELCTELAQWTGVEAEVYYAFHGPEGIQTRDYSLKPEYVDAIRRAEQTLRVLKKPDRPLDVDSFVTDKFIRQASQEFGLNYYAQLKDYTAVPFNQDAVDTHASVADAKLAGRSKLLSNLLMPPLELLRPIPAVAWIPLAVLMFPNPEESMVYITFVGSFYPILLNTIHGVGAVDPNLIFASLTLGASRLRVFSDVIVPGALPAIVTGLSIGMGNSWFSLVTAEMVAGQFCTGYYSWESYTLQKYPNIVLGMITIGLLGMLSSLLIKRIAWHFLPWAKLGGDR